MVRQLKFAPSNFPANQRVLNQKHQTPRAERSCIESWTKDLMTCRNREEQKRKEGTAKSRLVFYSRPIAESKFKKTNSPF